MSIARVKAKSHYYSFLATWVLVVQHTHYENVISEHPGLEQKMFALLAY